jgi:hypothetical protein
LVAKVAVFAMLAGIGSCLDKNAYWAPYNGDADEVAVDVGVPEEDARTADLVSTTGSTAIGQATIEPGAGPVGTEHTLTVILDDDFSEDVGRVTVEASSNRGLTTHELMQDSAQAGLWVVDVTSLGEDDEVREDTFRFILWQLSEKGEPNAVKED